MHGHFTGKMLACQNLNRGSTSSKIRFHRSRPFEGRSPPGQSISLLLNFSINVRCCQKVEAVEEELKFSLLRSIAQSYHLLKPELLVGIFP